MSGAASGPAYVIMDIRDIDARLESYTWSFSAERRADIELHWQTLIAQKPKMFNGRVLLQHQGAVRDGIFYARYFETDYADFIAWQHMGNPPPAMRNGFAMAALKTSDGAFLLGEMGAHTVNAGKIYFAAGTPDRNDVTPDGRVDLAGSVMRELGEETGLTPADVQTGAGWTIVMDAARVAFMRAVTIAMPAVEARALIRARIAGQDEPELSDIVIIRPGDETQAARMPPFMQHYLRHAFAGA
ncbi:MAG: NUDIX hydrolase [Beijerinckiaceae bacterium]